MKGRTENAFEKVGGIAISQRAIDVKGRMESGGAMRRRGERMERYKG